MMELSCIKREKYGPALLKGQSVIPRHGLGGRLTGGHQADRLVSSASNTISRCAEATPTRSGILLLRSGRRPVPRCSRLPIRHWPASGKAAPDRCCQLSSRRTNSTLRPEAGANAAVHQPEPVRPVAQRSSCVARSTDLIAEQIAEVLERPPLKERTPAGYPDALCRDA